MPAHFPRVDEVVYVLDAEKAAVGGDCIKIDEVFGERLDISSGRVLVRRAVRPKYIVTAVYAKIDLDRLATVALPWPTGEEACS